MKIAKAKDTAPNYPARSQTLPKIAATVAAGAATAALLAALAGCSEPALAGDVAYEVKRAPASKLTSCNEEVAYQGGMTYYNEVTGEIEYC